MECWVMANTNNGDFIILFPSWFLLSGGASNRVEDINVRQIKFIQVCNSSEDTTARYNTTGQPRWSDECTHCIYEQVNPFLIYRVIPLTSVEYAYTNARLNSLWQVYG